MKRILNAILTLFLISGLTGCDMAKTAYAYNASSDDIVSSEPVNTDFSSYFDEPSSEDVSSQAVDSSQTDSPQAVSSENVKSAAPIVNKNTVSSSPKKDTSSAAPVFKRTDKELRAVWISFYEMSFTDKSEQFFKDSLRTMFTKIKAMKMNAVVVHVRSQSDSFYPSSYYPWAAQLTGVPGKNPGFDPLKFMVDAAHEIGLEFHAWINPYRVSQSSNDFNKLAESCPARIWKTDNDKSNDDWAVAVDNRIYYNPAIVEVQRLVIDGVKEIVKNYNIDGIHFDDYFYPTTDPSFDAAAYSRYVNQTGSSKLSLLQWRTAQVSALVSGVYNAVKSIKKDVAFGISPAGNISNVLNAHCADVKTWMSSKSYVDYICPQIYWGFEHPLATAKFDKCLTDWSAMLTEPAVKLYIGLNINKSGIEDSESDEWIKNNDIIKRQVEFGRKNSKVSGFFFFCYSALVKDETSNKNELSNLLKIL